MTTVVLDYDPQPRQQVFHSAVARQILYGGAAGGGKSAAIRFDPIDFALNFPGFTAVLFRRTSVQLERNHIMEIRRELPAELGSYNETKKHFEFNNGSIFIFKHLEHEKDCEDIQGWEIHWAGVDEAGQFTPYQIDYIRSRVRLGKFQKKLERYVKERPELARMASMLPRMVLSANPGGQSHHYLKAKFIDPAPAETMFFDESLKDPDNPDDKGWPTMFVPATMRDNKYLDAGYAAQFGNMPDWMQKQLRDGDWNVIPGAFFDCFNSKEHVIRPFKMPPYWVRFRACDWGFATPFSIGWWAVSDGSVVTNSKGEKVSYPEGALIRYREWYGCKYKDGMATSQGLRIDGEALARGIKSREDESIRYSVADPSMWRSDGGPSNAEKAARAGIVFGRADNERETGWQQMYSMINSGKLYVFDTCKEFIRTVPALQADEKNPEDITSTNRGGEDHIADETRYAVMSRPNVNRPEKKGRTGALTFNDIMASRMKDRGERKYRWL